LACVHLNSGPRAAVTAEGRGTERLALSMRDKRTPTSREGDAAPAVGVQDDLDDGMLLAMLLDAEPPGLWSVEEVSRALGNRVTAMDSLMRLERDGLVHQLDRFVFPTRAAVRGEEVRL
jgi:hypothetical protein